MVKLKFKNLKNTVLLGLFEGVLIINTFSISLRTIFECRVHSRESIFQGRTLCKYFNLTSTRCCAQAHISSLKLAWFFRKNQTILLSIWSQLFDRIKRPEANGKKRLQCELKLLDNIKWMFCQNFFNTYEQTVWGSYHQFVFFWIEV